MERLLVVLSTLFAWALSSAILIVFCLLSVSEQIIRGSLVVAGVCLLGSVLALLCKRVVLAFVCAAAPAAVASVILASASRF